jgi:hypothetical protein
MDILALERNLDIVTGIDDGGNRFDEYDRVFGHFIFKLMGMSYIIPSNPKNRIYS